MGGKERQTDHYPCPGPFSLRAHWCSSWLACVLPLGGLDLWCVGLWPFDPCPRPSKFRGQPDPKS